MRLSSAGRRDEAFTTFDVSMAGMGDRLNGASSEWIEHNEKLAEEAGKATVGLIESSRWKMLSANTAALLLTGLLVGYVPAASSIPSARWKPPSKASPRAITPSKFPLQTQLMKPAD